MSTPQQQLISYIHHERQEQGSMLCAQHALNCLLQGQYFDAAQLAQIADELDRLEASELGLSRADIAARDQSSLNMDDSGFFSVSVLEKALHVWGLSLSNWRSESMRIRQQAPEDEKAFILNLNSHWFTIRSFGTTSKFWYNLNSFLPEPSWIGINYLGTLLSTAEMEGYSVFVVYTSEGSTGQSLQESDADQIADHLPAPGEGTDVTLPLSHSHGLRPQHGISAPASNTTTVDSGLADEDEELQAALSASLAQVPGDVGMTDSPARSRVRHTRGVSDEEGIETTRSAVETDADVDAIAPSRRRHRTGQDDVDMYGLGTVLRSAHDDPVDEELQRTMEASLASSRFTSASSSGVNIAGPSSSSSSSVSRPVGRRKRRAQGRQTGLTREDPIDLDGSRQSGSGDEADDFQEFWPASLSHSSPFLSPAMAAANRNNEDVDEIIDQDEEVSSDNEQVDWVSVTGARESSSVMGPGRDRHYDDEDAELQAALAASLGDTEAAIRFAAGSTVFGQAARTKEETEPIPADVDRISKMREAARIKQQAEREREARRARGEPMEEPEAVAVKQVEASRAPETMANAEEDEQEEAQEETLTSEEIRRRRLARFG